jgi:hypothetical protein
MILLAALALLVGLSLPAEAATYYASTSGSGTACSQASPCSLSTLLSTVTAGDTGILNPGSYSLSTTITGPSGTVANPITIKALNYAVVCSDPTNDPDGCEINTTSRSIWTGTVRINGADNWHFEGIQRNGTTQCWGASSNATTNFRLRFMHHESSGSNAVFMQYCNGMLYEHSYANRPNTTPGDYATIIYYSDDVTIRNIHISGNFNHGISLKRGNDNYLIERIVCEGWESECIFLGQNNDDDSTYLSPTQCSSVPRDDGTTGNLHDHTATNITVRNVFARGAQGFGTGFGIRISNVRNANIQGVFVNNTGDSPNGGRTDGTGFGQILGPTGLPEGSCGLEPGNNTLRGAIFVGSGATQQSCMRIQGNGHTPATLTIENVVCHAPQGGAVSAVNLTSGVDHSTGAWESTAIPTTTYRNFVHNDCSSSFSGSTATLTQQTGAAFNCGTAPSGALTVDPQFVGPESVPVPTLDFSNGRRLWDWAGTYQPIIDRFRTQNAPLQKLGESASPYELIIDRFRNQNASFVDAGTGTTPPCEGTCDIGANEFFRFELPPGVWESCAVYGNGDDVFEPFTNPWIDGRTGLVIDVDCAQKRFVIGRCDDPLDEETCDTDVYIHKAAQLRKKRVNEPITLSAGTIGSDADMSGLCWRTRATFDFTENLEELTGIWVRYEVDPDGGTHTCASPPGSVEWAWQAAE